MRAVVVVDIHPIVFFNGEHVFFADLEALGSALFHV
jgi:hypothetical protein